MARQLGDIVGALRSLRDYFAHFSKQEPLFMSELEVSEEVLGLILAGTDVTTRQRVRDIVERPLGDHYDGTGWHQFKSLVAEWLNVAEAVDPR